MFIPQILPKNIIATKEKAEQASEKSFEIFKQYNSSNNDYNQNAN